MVRLLIDDRESFDCLDIYMSGKTFCFFYVIKMSWSWIFRYLLGFLSPQYLRVYGTGNITEDPTNGCLPGNWGPNCGFFCGMCSNKVCNVETGICTSGCASGYVGNVCNETCESHKYGLECTETCGHCYLNESCDPIDGYCPKYCDPGWYGKKCNTKCPLDTYGFDCQFSCGMCKKGFCDEIFGGCSIEGCRSRFDGVRCDRCEAGYYGDTCDSECGNCLDGRTKCDPKEGHCLLGCEPGYDLPTCHQKTDTKSKVIVIGCLSGAFLTVLIILVVFLCKLTKSTNDEEDGDDGRDDIEKGMDNEIISETDTQSDNHAGDDPQKSKKSNDIDHIFMTEMGL